MKLVFASNNAHKLAEVRQIMPDGIEILSLNDIGFHAEIEETGVTLAQNSAIKAQAVCQWLTDNNRWADLDGVLADDTGLEIDVLNGEPGVYTARWAERETGVHLPEMKTYAANRAKALRELEGKTERGCQFHTVITLIKADGEQIIKDGIVRGKIAEKESGKGGFGYDPVFIPEGYYRTFGELDADVKNKISHRARALAELVNYLTMYDY